MAKKEKKVHICLIKSVFLLSQLKDLSEVKRVLKFKPCGSAANENQAITQHEILVR